MGNLTVRMGEPVYGKNPGRSEHHAWKFVVSGAESGAIYAGTYCTDIGIKPWTVGFADMLQSLAMDVTDENLCGSTEPPSVREVIEHLSHDVGFDNPLETYDIAVEMHRLSVWFWSLTPGEQTELCAYADEEED